MEGFVVGAIIATWIMTIISGSAAGLLVTSIVSFLTLAYLGLRR